MEWKKNYLSAMLRNIQVRCAEQAGRVQDKSQHPYASPLWKEIERAYDTLQETAADMLKVIEDDNRHSRSLRIAGSVSEGTAVGVRVYARLCRDDPSPSLQEEGGRLDDCALRMLEASKQLNAACTTQWETAGIPPKTVGLN